MLTADVPVVSPQNLESVFHHFTRLFAGFETLVLAVSGGPDSMALTGLFSLWRKQLNVTPHISIATVDHGLRLGAKDEAKLVASQAAKLGFPHKTLQWAGEKPTRGLQAKARLARYELLASLAKQQGATAIKKTAIVCAHTLDDQAETVMMRLAHGSSPLGLSGMAEQSTLAFCGAPEVALLRPLLNLPKAALIIFCNVYNWPFVQDPSNTNTDFTRVRWRGLMPALAKEGLDSARLSAFASQMARVEEALQFYAELLVGEAVFAPDGKSCVLAGALLHGAPYEIALRVLMLLLKHLNAPDYRRERLEAALNRLKTAYEAQEACAMTLAGFSFRQSKHGALTLVAAPPRRAS